MPVVGVGVGVRVGVGVGVRVGVGVGVRVGVGLAVGVGVEVGTRQVAPHFLPNPQFCPPNSVEQIQLLATQVAPG